MSQSTSTTALTQIVNWLAFGFRVPEDWEIVRHSVDFARGSLVFVDRVRQRLSVSWTACARAPDLDRLLTDFERAPRSAGETALDQEDCAGFRLLTCQTPSGDRVSHALCFDPLSNRLLELELPDSGASGAGALTRALLASFVFSGPEHPACVRAFGLHAELPSGFRLRRSQVKPADVSLEFTRPSQREGRSEDRLRIRRSGMARTWFDGDAARALRLRNPELVCADFEAVAVGPHAAVAAQAWPRGSVLQRALGRVAPRRVTVWACPAQNAVFETEIHARRGADAEGLEFGAVLSTHRSPFMAAEAALAPERVLSTKPTQNRAVRVENTASGVVLYVPLARPAWLRALALALPLRREKGFALDTLGREVWLACDGSRSFEAIVLEFASQHQLRFHEARAMVAEFLRTLTERKLVALVLPDEASPE